MIGPTCLLSLAALLPLAGRQDPGDLSTVLAERIAAAADLPAERLWAEAGTLSELADDLPAGTMTTALERLLEADSVSPRGLLLLAAARLGLEEPDWDALASRLAPLLDGDDEEVVRGAAGLLSDAGFHLLDPERRDALVSSLLAGSRDAVRAPATRLELAVTAWRLGSGREKRAARSEMLTFLQSSDPSLRGVAALALARARDLETARDELERLARTPGDAGLLADAFLQVERTRAYWASKNRNQRERLDQALAQQGPPRDLEKFERMIQLIQGRHIEGDLPHAERDALIDSGLQGMLQSLDTHSNYLSKEVFTKFQQDLDGEYGGIGAYVQNDPGDGLFTITRPIYSGPAYKGGLMSDDKVVRIDDWPTLEAGQGKAQDEIIRKLKGRPGTDVKLYIWRRGMDSALIDRPTEDMAVVITRELITIPPVRWDILPGRVALVELTQFSGVASQELARTLLTLLERERVEGVILDLRNNPGGLLNEARAVADLFLPPERLVVTTESRVAAPEHLYTAREALVDAEVPVVVLINRFSASASEIVSGALQDHDRAAVVGQRSFGKGSVQNLIPVRGERDDRFDDENGNGRFDNWETITRDWNENGEFDFAPRVKLTVARYLLPSGRSIHREFDEEGKIESPGGVVPDHEVDQRRWEHWKLEEIRDLRSDRAVRSWVADHWELHRDLFEELAYGDGDDTSRYPGFEGFHAELDTLLPPADLRFLLRTEIRRRVQDERGAAFPFGGDYQEDRQLQRAIEVVFDELGRSAWEIEAYARTFDGGAEEDGGEAVAARSSSEEERASVRDALAQLAAARREDGKLSDEALELLTGILNRLDH
ncbi:MAG: S41 family peptidase [Planctomycetota bacterium]|jgi:C-terminal peptidase prc|nr:S41 family peptidase [Planctomycetota bacterium]MDP6762855.1 S41 family peptidase [Planctomycetota bacterium]MDP6988733.1 S41 family peptidase [Planctomycetota bacterium]